jgi:hypothetical protein
MDHFFRTAYVPGWVNELEKLDPEWVKDLEKGWVKDLEKLRLQMGDVSRKITMLSCSEVGSVICNTRPSFEVNSPR